MKNYGRESVNGACLPCRLPARQLGVGQYPGALKGCGVKTKSSSGYDQISSKLLKKNGPIISKHLCLIVNRLLCTGIFPGRLKLAKVIPLFKKGDKLLFENYRPISLLTAISKIFERVVFNLQNMLH